VQSLNAVSVNQSPTPSNGSINSFGNGQMHPGSPQSAPQTNTGGIMTENALPPLTQEQMPDNYSATEHPPTSAFTPAPVESTSNLVSSEPTEQEEEPRSKQKNEAAYKITMRVAVILLVFTVLDVAYKIWSAYSLASVFSRIRGEPLVLDLPGLAIALLPKFMVPVILLTITLIGCKKKKVFGPIFGILYSVLIIFSPELISPALMLYVVGFIFLANCISALVRKRADNGQ